MLVKFNREVFSLSVISFCLNLLLFFSLSIYIPFGMAVLIIIFFGIVKNKKLFFNFFVQAVFFQNTFIAFFSGIIESESHFKILHGINFLLPLMFSVFVLKRSSDYFDQLFFRKSALVIFILVVYFIIGAYGYGFINSAQYLRLFLIPILFLMTGIYFSKVLKSEYFNQTLKTLFLLCAITTLLQLVFPFAISFLLNDLDYFRIKWGVDGWDELLLRYKSKKLFNISWFDLRLARIGSLIKSIISLGYFLTIFGIYFYLPKKKFHLFLIFLLVVFSVNSKGTILVLIFSSLLYFLFYRSNLSKPLALSFYLVCNTLLILLGYISKNEHIVGFVSGSDYLLSLGNGLGFGGNLSDTSLSSMNGPPLPDLGYWTRFQNGSESVYGVLFSSLGFFSFFYVYYFIEITVMLFKKMKNNTVQAKVLKVLAVVLLVQGIYQEEAFSPYAFGLVMFLVGLNLKSAYEEEAL